MLLSRTTRPFGKGLRNSCTKSSQIHQWVSQHFPNQLVYCVSDRLLASSWEWTNWHMTFSHSTVLLSDLLHRSENALQPFCKVCLSKLKGSWGRFLISKKHSIPRCLPVVPTKSCAPWRMESSQTTYYRKMWSPPWAWVRRVPARAIKRGKRFSQIRRRDFGLELFKSKISLIVLCIYRYTCYSINYLHVKVLPSKHIQSMRKGASQWRKQTYDSQVFQALSLNLCASNFQNPT